MRPSSRVSKKTDNLASVIDSLQLGGSGAGKIELAEDAVLEQQAVLDSGGVCKSSDNVAPVVQTGGFGGGSAGKIELREFALAEEKAMLVSSMVNKETIDF